MGMNYEVKHDDLFVSQIFVVMREINETEMTLNLVIHTYIYVKFLMALVLVCCFRSHAVYRGL